MKPTTKTTLRDKRFPNNSFEKKDFFFCCWRPLPSLNTIVGVILSRERNEQRNGRVFLSFFYRLFGRLTGLACFEIVDIISFPPLFSFSRFALGARRTKPEFEIKIKMKKLKKREEKEGRERSANPRRVSSLSLSPSHWFPPTKSA